MQCTSCGTEHPIATAYCSACGAKLSPSAAEPTPVGTDYESPSNEAQLNPYKQNPYSSPNQNEQPLPPPRVRTRQGIGALLSALTFGLFAWSAVSELKENPVIGIRFQIRSPRLVGPIFMCFGLIFGIPALVIFINTQNSLQGTVAGQGRIVSCQMQEVTNENNHSVSYVCQPMVHFTTTSGQEIEFVSSFSSDSFHAGDQVPVQYHPNHPQDAQISSFLSLWLLPLIFSGFGVLFFLIGLIVTLRSRYRY